MKVVLGMVFLMSSIALHAAIDGGVYHCHGIQYSTGDAFEVNTTPIRIDVLKNGQPLMTVNQDKNCMVISEKTEISSQDQRSVIVHMSAFEIGCDENNMLRNSVQLIINQSSSDRIANLSITRDFKTVEDVYVYCK
jgi:hypothetical protein